MSQLQEWRDRGENAGIGFEKLTSTIIETLGIAVTLHNIRHLVKTLGQMEYYASKVVQSLSQKELSERITDAENRIHALEFCYNRLVEQLSQQNLVDVNITRCLDDD